MTPDEYRDEVVEQLARTLARYTITASTTTGVTIEQHDRPPATQHTATAAVLADALATAGLMPTRVEWTARNTAGGGTIRDNREAAEDDRDRMQCVDRRPFQNPLPEVYSHIERRYVTNWREVGE